jgi:hypothetical protein
LVQVPNELVQRFLIVASRVLRNGQFFNPLFVYALARDEQHCVDSLRGHPPNVVGRMTERD